MLIVLNPQQWRNYSCQISLLILIILVSIINSPALVYQRNEILAGQWWRLISAHFGHVSWQHTLLNIGGLVLIFVLFPTVKGGQWLTVTILSCLGISLSLLWLNPHVLWYQGYSGVLHAYLLFAALLTLKDTKLSSTLILMFVIAKLAKEQFGGASSDLESFIGANVVIDAHLYGAVYGLVAYLVVSVYTKQFKGSRCQ